MKAFLMRKPGRAWLVLGLVLTCLGLNQPDVPLVTAQSGTGVIRVAPTGADNPACGSAAAPCQTIQYAVDSAAAGETIKLAQGTYSGSGTASVVKIANRSVTIIGGYSPPDWDTLSTDPTKTIVDGGNGRRGFEITSGKSVQVSIQNITVQNGLVNIPLSTNQYMGGGLYCRGATSSQFISLSLSNMHFKNNRVQGTSNGTVTGGGATFHSWCKATMQNMTFDGNQIIGGNAPDNTRGAIALGGGFFATDHSDIVGTNIVLTNNRAQAGSGGVGETADGQRADGLGGGAAMLSNAVSLSRLTATGNQVIAGGGSAKGSFGDGGALFFEHNVGTVIVADGVLQGNSVTGGASPAGEGGASGGGAIMSTDSVLQLDRLIMVNNTSTGGAGSDGGDAGGGALYFTRAPDPYGAPSTVIGNNLIIADNLAQAGAGSNRYGGGGGIFSQNTDLRLYHATIARNRILDTMTGPALIVLHYFGTSTARLYYSIISGHTTASWNWAAVAQQGGDTLQLDYTLFYNNGGNNAGGSGSVSSTNSVPSGDPAFVSPGSPNFDYHIKSTSAARDKAIGSTMTVDVDGESRPQGSASDVGADEYWPKSAKLVASKSYTPSNIVAGGSASHTVLHQITLKNIGQGDTTFSSLNDTLSTPASPLAMALSSGPTCSTGTCSYNSGTRQVTWSGNVPAGGQVTISFNTAVNVPTNYLTTVAIPTTVGFNYNSADGGSGNGTLTSFFLVNGEQLYLPIVLR